jgi:hypothetical protein
MTFSSGRGPHIWVPRRLYGLGQAAPGGKYIIPATIGTIEAVAAAGASAPAFVRTVSAGAQGYIPAQAAGSMRDEFRRNTGVDAPWVPLVDPTTSQGQSVIGQWAKDQAKVWASSQIGPGIEAGRRMYEEKLSAAGKPVEAEIRAAMPQDDISQWGYNYLLHHPELFTQAPTPETAVAMAQAFIVANCDRIGLPPEFIAASQLIHNFPTTVENAEQWGITLGTAYLSQYGVPIITDANPNTFLASCARGAIAQTFPGIPLSLCESTYGALLNGSVNFDEAQGLVIQACGWIAGAVGQAFGLPAPIGAVLGQVIAGVLVPIISDALGFGPSDSEKLNRAQEAAAKAAAAATIVCTDLARALWLQYQHYWESMQGNLNTLMRANQEWLTPTGSCGRDNGVFLFPATSPDADTLDLVRDEQGYAIVLNDDAVRTKNAKPQYLRYQKPVVGRSCSWPLGCPYGAYGIEGVVYRDKYDLSIAELKQKRVPNISQSGYAACDALGALAFWNARRYVTPFQVYLAMNGQEYAKERYFSAYDHVLAGKPNMWVQNYAYYQGSQMEAHTPVHWDSLVHSDEEYLANIGRVSTAGWAGEKVGDCMTPKWGAYLSGSLQQAAAASALVQRDVTRTVSSGMSQYGVQRHMEELAGNKWMVASAAQQRAAVRAAAARAASFRTAITEAKRKGQLRGERMNYGLLAAGGAALAGWAVARRKR